MTMRPVLATLLVLLGAATMARSQPRALLLYVSPQGSDAGPGTRARPFATLERARDAIRARKAAGGLPRGGVTVVLRGGIYERKAGFTLTERDSGAPGAPIVYRAGAGETPRLLGGAVVRGFRPVTDRAILDRLDPAARGKVVQADLRAQGLTDYGSLTRRGFGASGRPAGLELFFENRPMTLARWPNVGWARIAGVPAGPEGGRFTFEGDRPARWKAARDIWLHGYWTHDWAESYEKVRAIDLERREIATEPPHGVYGYTAGKRYYALNLLEELDAPGEWYLDRKTGKLYFWPPAPLAPGKAIVSVLEQPLVSFENVSHVSLRGLTLEAARGVGVRIRGGTGCRVAGCTVRGVGTDAIQVQGGANHGVISCDITQTGEGGIALDGGDRKTLTPCGHFAVNNHIYDYSRWVQTYQPGVGVGGVGCRVANNRIHDAPHNAIHLSGNEHIIERNDIFRVCLQTEDAGAFYMGRDYTMRGNVLRHNYFHDLRVLEGLKGDFSVMAVYLDDCASGTTITGNLFVRAGRAVMIGGGRDNTVENNVFIDCDPAVWVDARALGWAKAHADIPGGDWQMGEKLLAMNYKAPPYRTRYPRLASILEDDYRVPKGNRIVRNIVRGGRWLDLKDRLTDETITIENNWTEGDPGFVAPEKGDYRLWRRAPVIAAIGFQFIPSDKIGLFKDEYRRTLPPKE